MLFNFLKRNNPPTERCKLLKEKVLDVVEPTFFLGYWSWSQDAIGISYFPEYHTATVYTKGGWSELTRKESKWLALQAEEVVKQNEDRVVEELLEKLRSL